MISLPTYDTIFSITSEKEFNDSALQIFKYQYHNVAVYKEYIDLLQIDVYSIDSYKKIPFLPIQFFKSKKVLAESAKSQTVFTSSGTTGAITSKHYVADVALYEKSFIKAFTAAYGNVKNLTILALLPSYLEREGSSLVYMVDRLIAMSSQSLSGFYLDEYDELIAHLQTLESQGKKTILLGVSYALLDLIERTQFKLEHTVIMETGGMKGRRKEMVKEELHEQLCAGFGVSQIHSEYGMTELLSQAYSKGNGLFAPPPWVKILTRNPENPLQLIVKKTGGINVIDLANMHSCSFIATQDLGKGNLDGSFEIIGRFDSSDIRGCNLMVL